MNIYDYIKNLYTKGRVFTKSVESKMADDYNKLMNMFFQPNLSKNITAYNNIKKKHRIMASNSGDCFYNIIPKYIFRHCYIFLFYVYCLLLPRCNPRS